MKVLDIGCAMGFFSLPIARMVGTNGKVICVDVQEKMIHSLKKRAEKAGLSDIIQIRICTHNSLCLEDVTGEINFALAAAVVHEVPDGSVFFAEVYQTMKKHGRLLVVEPGGRVSEEDFEKTVSVARKIGFKVMNRPQIKRSRAVLLEK
jgi:ubiquinone/menaquinone biosynthesis C-methylase UbiE